MLNPLVVIILYFVDNFFMMGMWSWKLFLKTSPCDNNGTEAPM